MSDGRTIDIDFRKWVSKPHWRFSMYHMANDEWGTWLWTPPGSAARRGLEEPKTFSHMNVKLIPRNAWWTAMWNDGERFDLYVDIITPPAWHGDRVTMIDIDLDLMREVDGTVHVVDEDEFAEHQVLYGYPDNVVTKSRAITTELEAALNADREPFNQVGAERMRQAAELMASL